MSEVLTHIRSMRRYAAQALADVLRETRDGFPSETRLRDMWHERLTEDLTSCSEGWYLPPPHGIVLVIGDSPLFGRLDVPTFRPENAWPSPQHRLRKDSLLSVYSSRVHRGTGVIGDFGCSLYRGADAAIRDHLRRVWNVTMGIAEEVSPGTTFTQLYDRAMELLRRESLMNNIYSVHDGCETNIGHTIPWSHEPLLDDDRLILTDGTPRQVADLVGRQRRFISPTESLEITSDMALTIEPRANRPGLPPAWFHVVVGFEEGRRVVITEFEPLFELWGMDYLR
ncbi:MAG: M24 family metallopeptidase [Mycobacteriales bacterium]